MCFGIWETEGPGNVDSRSPVEPMTSCFCSVTIPMDPTATFSEGIENLLKTPQLSTFLEGIWIPREYYDHQFSSMFVQCDSQNNMW